MSDGLCKSLLFLAFLMPFALAGCLILFVFI